MFLSKSQTINLAVFIVCTFCWIKVSAYVKSVGWYCGPNHSHLSPDTYIQKTKKSYIDSRARRNLGSVNSELHDVQRIMVANIEEVLQRGEALSGEWTLFATCFSLKILFVFVKALCILPCFLPYLFVALDSKASNLSSLSKKYRSDAKYLNTRSTYAKVAAGAVIFITLIVYVRFWWLWIYVTNSSRNSQGLTHKNGSDTKESVLALRLCLF